MRKIEGKKAGDYGMMASTKKGDLMYPHFGINAEHLPEAKSWEIGKEYDVTLRLKQTGINVHHAEFEIRGIQVHGPVKNEPKRYSRAVATKK